MILAPHWDIKEYMREFRLDDDNPKIYHDARLPVLITLVLYANTRLRCWPSTKTLCQVTGYGQAAVVEAREWLIKHKAITLVEYDKREGDEQKLPQRQFVYQLTGSIMTSQGIRPYVMMTPETAHQSAQELQEAEGKVSIVETSETAGEPADHPQSVEVSTTEISDLEISTVETKVISIKEDNPNDQGKDSSTPTVAGEETTPPNPVPKKRERDEEYDMVAEVWFDAPRDSAKFKALRSRIVLHSQWLKQRPIQVKRKDDSGKTQTIDIQGCSRVVTRAMLIQAKADWLKEHPKASLPLDILKFIDWMDTWLRRWTEKPPDNPTPDPVMARLMGVHHG